MLAKGGPASAREMAGRFQEQATRLGRGSSLGAKAVKELNRQPLPAAGSLRFFIHAGIGSVRAISTMKVSRDIRHREHGEHLCATLLLLHGAVVCRCLLRFSGAHIESYCKRIGSVRGRRILRECPYYEQILNAPKNLAELAETLSLPPPTANISPPLPL